MIEIRELKKSYKTGEFVQKALDGISLCFRDSEFIAVLGTSGSGKTTLLNALGGLDHADSGDILIDGTSTASYKAADWDTYRNHHIGFIFQSYNLIPHQSVLSNVELALTLAGVRTSERRERAMEALAKVGLSEHCSKKPSQLSGGQAQRVAIARAIVNEPDVILADEPTGALDTETGLQVMEILAELAKTRLVVMVTHNPELAQRYATRIVKLQDGRIISDSDPYDPESQGHFVSLAELAASDNAPEKKRRAKMGFLTALGLSFSNLMTKKGRTFMTAFAGSIGIIGIAAILSLSNGVNNYIFDTEEEALASYPLTITKSTMDLSSLMTTTIGYRSGSNPQDGEQASSGNERNIPESHLMADMLAQVKNNDLKAFREYIESDEDPLGEYVNAIRYRYGITPLVYKSDTSAGTVQLNPSQAGSSLGSGLMSSAFSSSMSLSDSFSELIDDDDMIHRQLELIEGKWPESYNECLLVLNRAGEVSDYTLYSIGVRDTDVMNELMEKVLAGEEVEVPKDEGKAFSYDDALSLSFKVVPRYDLYRHNDEAGLWSNVSGDSEAIKRRIDRGIDLNVVGVVKPSPEFSGNPPAEGIAYTADLTSELMKRASESAIVKEQLADPNRDVFTGKTFEELRDEEASRFDMESMFTVDEEALKKAFSMDTSAFDFSGFSLDFTNIPLPSAEISDFTSLSLDSSILSSVLSEDRMREILSSAPPFELPEEIGTESLALNDEQRAAVDRAASELSASFTAWMMINGKTAPTEPSGYVDLFQEYLDDPNSGGKEIMEGLSANLGEDARQYLSEQMRIYLSGSFAPYIASSLQSALNDAAQVMASEMAARMSAQISALTQSYSSAISNAISGQLSAKMSELSDTMRNGFSFDANAFADAIKVNVTQEDLANLFQSYMSGEKASCDSNLSELGYAEPDSPQSISIYPKDFSAKKSVTNVIDAYNEKQRNEDSDEKTIKYSDIAGVLMSSVTDIVDTISLVLIAFVSISLIVSSIMIGIITYISVLERRKEIGILRAMGASKGNIANVFNAETIIEGAISGCFAIAMVLIASFPVNAVVEEGFDVPNIMTLPWDAAAILIGVSIALTFVAGLIPSQSASHKDPVEALRSE